MQKYFVETYSPGTFWNEQSEIEIPSLDVNEAIKVCKNVVERYGAKPYAFRLITRERLDNELDSRVTNRSGFYYINGIVETYDEIKAKNDPTNETLLWNMRTNGWDKVVTTYSPWKWTSTLEENDQIINIDME